MENGKRKMENGSCDQLKPIAAMIIAGDCLYRNPAILSSFSIFHFPFSIFFLCLLAFAGCQGMQSADVCPPGLGTRKNFLRSANELHREDVMLEVIMLRCPYGDPRLNDELWNDADEQMLSPSLRKRLAGNGFRVGVVGNQIPYSLMQLMEMKDEPPPTSGVTTIRLDDMVNTPKVMRADIYVEDDRPYEIYASGVKPEATILFNENGTPGGRTFQDVQGVFAMKTRQKGDGWVSVEVTPELQYGEMRQKFTSDTGTARITMARPKQIFESLACEMAIAPGQIIIISNLKNQHGNLGHFFLTDDDAEKRYQKIICIRVRNTARHDMFPRDGTLPLDMPELFSEAE